jgi:hypothetical protein
VLTTSARATMEQDKQATSTSQQQQQQQQRVVGNFCIEALLGRREDNSSRVSECGSEACSVSPPMSPGCEGESPPPVPNLLLQPNSHPMAPHHAPAVVLSRFYPPPHHPPPHPPGAAGLYYPGTGASAFHPLLGDLRNKTDVTRVEFNGEYNK